MGTPIFCNKICLMTIFLKKVEVQSKFAITNRNSILGSPSPNHPSHQPSPNASVENSKTAHFQRILLHFERLFGYVMLLFAVSLCFWHCFNFVLNTSIYKTSLNSLLPWLSDCFVSFLNVFTIHFYFWVCDISAAHETCNPSCKFIFSVFGLFCVLAVCFCFWFNFCLFQ